MRIKLNGCRVLVAVTAFLVLCGCGNTKVDEDAEIHLELTKVLNSIDAGILAEDAERIYYTNVENQLLAFNKADQSVEILAQDVSNRLYPLKNGIIFETEKELFKSYDLCYYNFDTNHTEIISNAVNHHNAQELGETLIFAQEDPDLICQYNLESGALTVLYEGHSRNLFVYEGDIYFLHRDETVEYKKQISLRCLDVATGYITSLPIGDQMYSFLIHKGELYGATSSEIISYNLEQEQRTVLYASPEPISDGNTLHYYDNELYFHSSGNMGSSLCALHVETLKLRKVAGHVNFMYFIDGKLYALTVGHGWACYNPKTGNKIKIDLPGLE